MAEPDIDAIRARVEEARERGEREREANAERDRNK